MKEHYRRMVFALPFLVVGIVLAGSDIPYYGLAPYVNAFGLLVLLASAAVIIYNFTHIVRRK